MHVRVIESGHHEMPAEVDYLGVFSLKLLNVRVGANRNDAVAAHGNRLGALQEHSSHDGIASIFANQKDCAGKNVAIDEDAVNRLWGLSRFGKRGER